jgi:hypothetical protein
MSETPDHPYFHPLPERAELLAAHLHKRWQEHEAEVAQWSDKKPRSWESLEPDQQRGYRAIAVAALELLFNTDFLFTENPRDPQCSSTLPT